MTNKEAIIAIRYNYPPSSYSMLREALDMSMKLLEQQEWIPTAERTPLKAGTYIGTVKFEDGSTGSYPVWWHNGIRTDIDWEMDKMQVNVIAWKPMPEKYKAEEIK